MPVSCAIIVLAKDRRAQLKLLLRSIAQNWPEARVLQVVDEPAGTEFQWAVMNALARCDTEYVAFMCDDGVVYRRVNDGLWRRTMNWTSVLCYSLRLGENTVTCYPSDTPNMMPLPLTPSIWRWHGLEGDFGYPGSVDAHIFRTSDLRELLLGCQVENPTALECALVARCEDVREKKPMMGCPPLSCYVGVPVNRVSSQSGVRFGDSFPQPAAVLDEYCERNGYRLSLEGTSWDDVDGAHAEVRFHFELDNPNSVGS